MQLCDFGPNSDVRVERIQVNEWETKYACTYQDRSYETCDPLLMHQHLVVTHKNRHHKVPREVFSQIGQAVSRAR